MWPPGSFRMGLVAVTTTPDLCGEGGAGVISVKEAPMKLVMKLNGASGG